MAQASELMVIAEVSVIPVGTKTPSVSEYVEGELSDVLELTKVIHLSVFDEEVKRVVTSIKIDDRRDKISTIDYKVQSVMKKLA